MPSLPSRSTPLRICPLRFFLSFFSNFIHFLTQPHGSPHQPSPSSRRRDPASRCAGRGRRRPSRRWGRGTAGPCRGSGASARWRRGRGRGRGRRRRRSWRSAGPWARRRTRGWPRRPGRTSTWAPSARRACTRPAAPGTACVARRRPWGGGRGGSVMCWLIRVVLDVQSSASISAFLFSPLAPLLLLLLPFFSRFRV